MRSRRHDQDAAAPKSRDIFSARKTGRSTGPCGGEDSDVRLQVQERLDVKDKDHDFRFAFGDEGDENQVRSKKPCAGT